MIKSDKESTLIEGSYLDVATQFLHIMDAMLETRPEMVVAYIHARNKEIEKAVKSANVDEIRMAEAVFKGVSTIERMLNDEE